MDKACTSKDINAIKTEIKNIQDGGMETQLADEIRRAETIVELYERMNKFKHKYLRPDKAIAEIRRYHNPLPTVHKVIQATLLLLGEDEYATKVLNSVVSCYNSIHYCNDFHLKFL